MEGLNTRLDKANAAKAANAQAFIKKEKPQQLERKKWFQFADAVNKMKELEAAVKAVKIPKVKKVWDSDIGLWLEPAKQAELHAGGPFHSSYNFIAALQKKGFKRLGSGAFSTVLARDGSARVLKVTRREDNWINYALWAAKEGWAGTFAPQVFSYKKIKTTTGGYFEVTVMERLPKELNGSEYGSDARVVSSLLSNTVYYNSDLSQLLVDEVYPGMGQFAAAMRDHFSGTHWDLHGGNMMVRENGMLVITDPMVDDRVNPHKRLKVGDFSPTITLH